MRLAAKLDEIDAQDREPAAHARGARAGAACACDSLDRCTCGAAFLARARARAGLGRAAARHQRRERRQHVAADDARRSVLSWDDVLHEGPVPARPARRARAGARAVPRGAGLGQSASAARAELERRDEVPRARRSPRPQSSSGSSTTSTTSCSSSRSWRSPATAAELIQADADLGPLRRTSSRRSGRSAGPSRCALARPRGVGRLPARSRPVSSSWPAATGRGFPTSARRCCGCSRSSRTPGRAFRVPSGSCSSRCWTGRSGRCSSSVSSQAREEAAFLGDAWAWSGWPSSCRWSKSFRRRRRSVTRGSSCPSR